jgi:hypothetical protein
MAKKLGQIWQADVGFLPLDIVRLSDAKAVAARFNDVRLFGVQSSMDNDSVKANFFANAGGGK